MSESREKKQWSFGVNTALVTVTLMSIFANYLFYSGKIRSEEQDYATRIELAERAINGTKGIK